jgi:ubiquinone/menaquinone biosynthesis C-methylase UbiE
MAEPPQDPASRTRASYDAIAERFRERTRDRSRMRETVDRFAARVGRDALVLDIGAGPGSDSAELRQRGLRVISVDLSLGMLRSGQRDYPGPRVQADMAKLPFRAIAAGLWVNASLLHVARTRVPAVLHELRRVLVAPGILHVSVKTGRDDGWETARYGDEHPRWFTYWTPEALDAALAAAGFRILEAELREGTQDDWLVRSCATPGAPARAID